MRGVETGRFKSVTSVTIVPAKAVIASPTFEATTKVVTSSHWYSRPSSRLYPYFYEGKITLDIYKEWHAFILNILNTNYLPDNVRVLVKHQEAFPKELNYYSKRIYEWSLPQLGYTLALGKIYCTKTLIFRYTHRSKHVYEVKGVRRPLRMQGNCPEVTSGSD